MHQAVSMAATMFVKLNESLHEPIENLLYVLSYSSNMMHQIHEHNGTALALNSFHHRCCWCYCLVNGFMTFPWICTPYFFKKLWRPYIYSDFKSFINWKTHNVIENNEADDSRGVLIIIVLFSLGLVTFSGKNQNTWRGHCTFFATSDPSLMNKTHLKQNDSEYLSSSAI